MRRLSTVILDEKASKATKAALSKCVFPENFQQERVFFEVLVGEDFYVYKLYYSGENESEEDILLARTKINRYTAEVEIETFLDKKQVFIK